MDLERNTYDQYADEYLSLIQEWGNSGYSLYHDLVIPQVLAFLGEVEGRRVLDAGCGEGFVARLLASKGAWVTAVDISPRLVELAKEQDTSGRVQYRVQDLSRGFAVGDPLFDLVVSNLVLNDVYDYAGYIATLGAVTKPGGRLVLSLNNPYSAVLRGKAQRYHDSGTAVLYDGLSRKGVRVYHFHRTLEDYITTFRDAGFLLRSLSDLRATSPLPDPVIDHIVSEDRMPFVIVLELVKANHTAEKSYS